MYLLVYAASLYISLGKKDIGRDPERMSTRIHIDMIGGCYTWGEPNGTWLKIWFGPYRPITGLVVLNRKQEVEKRDKKMQKDGSECDLGDIREAL